MESNISSDIADKNASKFESILLDFEDVGKNVELELEIDVSNTKFIFKKANKKSKSLLVIFVLH